VDVAGGIVKRLGTRGNLNLVDRTDVHTIRTCLEVDHLGGNGCRDQDESEERAQTQHGGSKAVLGMQALRVWTWAQKRAYLRTHSTP